MTEYQGECQHKDKFPMPDSIAEVCKECGQVWVGGEPWEYRSGNITEWLDDICKTSQTRRDGMQIRCPTCAGKGTVDKQYPGTVSMGCRTCNGTGWVAEGTNENR